METLDSVTNVIAALQKAQEKFDKILKDTNNPFFKSKYATLDQVIAATRPHLSAEGLVLVQENIRDGERYGVATRLLHLQSGEELTSSLVAKPKEDIIQQVTGILTYARRYEYLTILGLAPEDDDGAVASGTSGSREPEVRRPQSVQQSVASAAKGQYPTKAVIPPFPSAPNMTSTAIAGDLAHDLKPPAPATQPQIQESASTPAESAPKTDSDAIPNEREYQAYATRAMAVLETLERNGLVNGKGMASAKTKFKKYLCATGGVKDTKGLSHGRWDVIFTESAKLFATLEGTKKLVGLVEAATKETK